MSVFNPADFAAPVAVSLQYLQQNYTTTTDLDAELETKAPIVFTGASNENYLQIPEGVANAFDIHSINGGQQPTYIAVDTTSLGGAMYLQAASLQLFDFSGNGGNLTINQNGVQTSSFHVNWNNWISASAATNTAAQDAGAEVGDFYTFDNGAGSVGVYLRTS